MSARVLPKNKILLLYLVEHNKRETRLYYFPRT